MDVLNENANEEIIPGNFNGIDIQQLKLKWT